MKYIIRIFWVSSFLWMHNCVKSQTPSTISIQGTLMDARGQAAKDGTFNVQFRLYDTPEGGTINWHENASIETTGGIYSHYLGSVTPLTADIFEKTQYLAIKVGNIEIVPRTLITYAPYTFACNSTFIADKVICSGALGDIKYSILNPSLFAQENGTCWVPMDGRNVFGSQWSVLTGANNVPNAGGMFFRSHEYSNSNDPDRTPSSPIATAQNQGFKSHSHTGQTNPDLGHNHMLSGGGLIQQNGSGFVANFDPDFDPTLPEADVRNLRSGTSSPSGGHSHNITTDPNPGGDTRPKNLSLYAYIRVN
jgi:hypothetical protein